MDQLDRQWDFLYTACEEGNLEMVKKMCLKLAVKEGLDFDNPRWSALLGLVHRIGHTQVEDYLGSMQKYGSMSDKEVALYQAISQRDLPIVEFLVRSGLSDVNGGDYSGLTPLYMACESGEVDMVRCLAVEGADLHALHRQDMTALHIACEMGNTELVKVLIRHGANVNMRVPVSNWTPLHKACYYKQPAAALLLIEKGAKVNMKDVHGNTPLYISCDKGLAGTVEELLGKGADVNTTNTRGQTALHIACIRGYRQIVLLLLQRGAEAALAQKDGRTPLYIACLAAHLYTDKCDLAKADRSCSLELSSIEKCFQPDGCIISILLHYGTTANRWCRPWHDNTVLRKDLHALEILLEHCVYPLSSSLMDYYHYEPLMLLMRAGWKEPWGLRFLIRKSIKIGDCNVLKFALNVDPFFIHMYPIFEHFSDLKAECVGENLAWYYLQEKRTKVPSLQQVCVAYIRLCLTRAKWGYSIMPSIWTLPLPTKIQMRLRMEGHIQELLQQ